VAYTVQLRPAAARALRKLAKVEQKRIGARIDTLAANPRPAGAKLLAGPEKLYRVRVGDYRIIYQIRDSVLLVLVVRIGWGVVENRPRNG